MITITININVPEKEEFVVKTQQQIEDKLQINKQIVRKSLGPVPRPTAEILQKQQNPKMKEEEEAWDAEISKLQ